MVEATTATEGSDLDEWKSFIAQPGLPCFLIPLLPPYSPLLATTSFSLYALPTLKPSYHAKAMRRSIHAWLTVPV